MGKIFSAKKAANMVVIIMVIGIVLALMAPSALGKAAGRGSASGRRGGGFGRRGGGFGRRGGGRFTNGYHARGHSRSSAVALDPGPAFGFVQLMPFVFFVFFFA